MMKPSGIGGQAVIEGVMMKNKEQYATAVRKPDNEIVIEKGTYISIAEKYKIFKLPIFRGVLAFAESMIIGTKTLTFSASFYEEEETKPSKVETAFNKVFKEKAESVAMGLTFMVSILLAVGIFVVLPRFIAGLLESSITSTILLTIIEGILRIVIFIAYVLAIAQMNDIKRLFMYHGAEHKTINCLEHGYELTVENVRKQSKQHKRCGTSFLFIVMFVSIIFFIFIRVDQEWLRYVIRILLIPVIAGVSYEFIRFAGKSDSKIADILSKPGLWMQGLTTKEPDDGMIEVAIQSVEAVFDWRAFLNLEPDDSSKDEKIDNQLTIETKKETGKEVRKITKKENGKETDKEIRKVPDQVNEKEAGKEIRKIPDKKNGKKTGKEINKLPDNDIRKETSNETGRKESAITRENKEQQSKTNKNIKTNHKKVEEYKKSSEEMAVTKEKVLPKEKAILDEEEDDEILRALDQYFLEREDSKDKE